MRITVEVHVDDLIDAESLSDSVFDAIYNNEFDIDSLVINVSTPDGDLSTSFKQERK